MNLAFSLLIPLQERTPHNDSDFVFANVACALNVVVSLPARPGDGENMLGQVSSKGLRWGTDGDDGVGPSYHVMTITWCGGQPRGCPGG